MLKLKLQYFGHLMQRADSLEKTLMLGKTECKRRRGWHRMRRLDSINGHKWTQWTWIWANARRQWRNDREACAAVHGVTKSQTQLSNWTELISVSACPYDLLSLTETNSRYTFPNTWPLSVLCQAFSLHCCCLVAKSCPNIMWSHGL